MKLTALLDRLHAVRIGEPEEAGLALLSLPWPREAVLPLQFGEGMTTALPLGRWPGESEAPRRLLLMSHAPKGPAPERLPLSVGMARSDSGSAPVHAFAESWERSPEFENYWESHLLRLTAGGRSLGMMMGLRFEGKTHWWEACRLIVREESPECTVIEMAGSIPRCRMTLRELREEVGYHNHYLHRHNWLTGRIYARLHSNGVCEIYASHINNRFVDDGADLPGVVPVVGFALEGGVPPQRWEGPADGRFCTGGVEFDLREAARLSRPGQQGGWSSEAGWMVWQPYLGAELYGGVCPKALTGDPFIVHAEDALFPRGMARTLRFSLNLAGGSPVVQRYVAPAWWYGLCEELLPAPLLPVVGEDEPAVEEARQWVLGQIVEGGFEDGSVPRGAGIVDADAKGRPRAEPGWEGEMPYAQFLTAWRTGATEDYEAAMRSAYYFTDVAIDHANKLVRMHGYAPPALSLPMNRVQGTVAAYLETGDPYLYDTARAVVTTAHWMHKNSWPRMAVGRDACYLRSAVLLHRYFGTEFWSELAHEAALTVVQSQRENGSFGDQGGGSGIHQWSGYISKPWMGLLALNGVLDYLELFPGDPPLEATVRRFADWLLSERTGEPGQRGWCYQHDYNGARHFTMPHTGENVILPGPRPWLHASLGRLMAHCTRRYGDPLYLQAWDESFAALRREPNDHSIGAALQFLPWLEAHRWNAVWHRDGLACIPLDPHTCRRATVLTPDGGHPIAAPSVRQDESFPVSP